MYNASGLIVISKNIVVVLPTVLSARIATVIQLISHLLIVAVVWEDSYIADSCTVSVSYKSICGTDVFHMHDTGIFQSWYWDIPCMHAPYTVQLQAYIPLLVDYKCTCTCCNWQVH